MCQIGFSPRKAQLEVYIVSGFPAHAELVTRLGKHTIDEARLYLAWLDGVDLPLLEDLCAAAWRKWRGAIPCRLG